MSSQVAADVSHTESHYPEALRSTPPVLAGKSSVIVLSGRSDVTLVPFVPRCTHAAHISGGFYSRLSVLVAFRYYQWGFHLICLC